MSKYVISNGTFIDVDDKLVHALKPKFKPHTKDFKYVAKVYTTNGVRYFYTQAEYDAYLKNTASSTKPTVEQKPKDTFDVKQTLTTALKDVTEKINKIDRYLKAAEIWYDDWAGVPVKDLITGTHKPLTWQESKEHIDRSYVGGNPNKLLTDKYKKISAETHENSYWDEKTKTWINKGR